MKLVRRSKLATLLEKHVRLVFYPTSIPIVTIRLQFGEQLNCRGRQAGRQ